jgi:hypothetical protein
MHAMRVLNKIAHQALAASRLVAQLTLKTKVHHPSLVVARQIPALDAKVIASTRTTPNVRPLV